MNAMFGAQEEMLSVMEPFAIYCTLFCCLVRYLLIKGGLIIQENSVSPNTDIVFILTAVKHHKFLDESHISTWSLITSSDAKLPKTLAYHSAVSSTINQVILVA